MSRPVKCQFCGEKFIREDNNFEKTSKGFYHRACYETQKEEKSNRGGLLQYIHVLFGDSGVNYGLINKQIKNFTEQLLYTESGIHGTLYYCYEIKKMPISRANGIGIVPYFYNEARDYYKIKENAKNQEIIKYEDKVIFITSPQKEVKVYKEVDLEALFTEEELNGNN